MKGGISLASTGYIQVHAYTSRAQIPLKDVAIAIAEAVKEKIGVGTAAHGLCFFLPVEMSTLTIHDGEFEE